MKSSADQDNAEVPAKVFEFGGKDDFQLQQALNLLAGKPVQKARPAPRPRPTPSPAAALPSA